MYRLDIYTTCNKTFLDFFTYLLLEFCLNIYIILNLFIYILSKENKSYSSKSKDLQFLNIIVKFYIEKLSLSSLGLCSYMKLIVHIYLKLKNNNEMITN